MVLKNLPLFLISLIFQMTSPQTLSPSELPWRWMPWGTGCSSSFLQLASLCVCRDLLRSHLGELSLTLSPVLADAQGGPSEILGAYQCSDLEPAHIRGGPWDSAYLISSLISPAWLLILLASPHPPPELLGAVAVILARSTFFSAKRENNNHNYSKKFRAHFKLIVSPHLRNLLQWTFPVN